MSYRELQPDDVLQLGDVMKNVAGKMNGIGPELYGLTVERARLVYNIPVNVIRFYRPIESKESIQALSDPSHIILHPDEYAKPKADSEKLKAILEILNTK